MVAVLLGTHLANVLDCLGGFKWVILSNGVGWSEFYVNIVNIDWSGLKWILYAKQYDYI